MFRKINDWLVRRKAKRITASLANEIAKNKEKIDCGNFYVIPRAYPGLDLAEAYPVWLTVYPKQLDHLEKLVNLHLRWPKEKKDNAPSKFYPGSLGILDFFESQTSGHSMAGIRFIQGSYLLKSDSTSKRDAPLTFERKEFRKLYANWRATLFNHALDHLKEKGEQHVMVLLTESGQSTKHIQKDLDAICKRKKYSVTHYDSWGYSYVKL